VRDPSPDHAAVRVLNTAMRPGTRLIGPAEVTARYGITPGQYPDFRALCGDASDNIPGVRGSGPRRPPPCWPAAWSWRTCPPPGGFPAARERRSLVVCHEHGTTC
jgi:DNA polymerase-1